MDGGWVYVEACNLDTPPIRPFVSHNNFLRLFFIVGRYSGAVGGDVQLLGRIGPPTGDRAQQGHHRGCVVAVHFVYRTRVDGGTQLVVSCPPTFAVDPAAANLNTR